MEFSGLKRTIAPALEPLTTAEAKTYLRVDHSDEDTLIDAMIASAREAAEEYIRRALINQTWTMTIPDIPAKGILLPRPPVSSVTSLAYLEDSDKTTYTAWTDYHLDTFGEPARLYLDIAPTGAAAWDQKWKLIWVAGYGATADDVPKQIVNALKVIVSHFYENRGGDEPIPQSAKYLLDPFRTLNQ